ncbi:MAG TPA: ABC transporter permease subunit [Nitrospiraceae bacterium]|nr:ABC transporter permease subunit [Nitrospiraceae bacterium]
MTMPTKPRWRAVVDRFAGWIITVGGLATIVSILAIFFFLLREVTPLFSAPSAKLAQRLTLPARLADGPVVLGVDDRRTVAYLLTAGGLLFVDLRSGQVVPIDMPAELKGRRLTALAHSGGQATRYVAGTAEGDLLFLKMGVSSTFASNGQRITSPVIKVGHPVHVVEGPITDLSYRFAEGGSRLALLLERQQLLLAEIDESAPQGMVRKRLAQPISGATSVALDATLEHLYVGTDGGRIIHLGLVNGEPDVIRGSYEVTPSSEAITRLAFLSGDRSLVVMTSGGAVSTWGLVRRTDDPSLWRLQRTHELESHAAPIVAYAPSQRVKSFATADASGRIFVHHATSEKTEIRLSNGSSLIMALAIAPKGDGLLAFDALGHLSVYDLHNPYPEVTFQTLFGKVWYDGYERPEHVWQSSAGSDDFEPKLGLMPLAFGTLKGTVYALLLAIPIAIFAAIFTSQFMHPNYRATIKPIIEVMAALPTVVLGFLAGLWLAPLLERLFPAMIGMTLAIPLVVVASALLWHFLPPRFTGGIAPGSESLLLIPIIAAAIGGCLWANQSIEAALFGGDYKGWLLNAFGIQYDQRNALVVGIVMGFAIIPVIYSIAEEALTNVPRSQIAASLALGATRWQTVVRLVFLSASPGIFSAIMIGFGRAVGETMIVLMAAGNTPILDWNWANGFRTLSANIAVEIPEAPQGGSLYRVLFLAALLLFVLTFAVNSIAEIVRQRLREKYSHG